MAPASAKRCRRLARDGGDFGIDRRDAEIGRIGDALRLACRSARRTGTMSAAPAATADRPDARRSWRRAAARDPRHCAPSGPATPRLRSICAAGVCATRPMLGRMPTTPQKLAGLRSEPPMSEPCASHAMPVASATAAPPEEPAAERDSVPGIARRAEHLVEGVGAGAEFRRVRLGVDHRRRWSRDARPGCRSSRGRCPCRSASPAWSARPRHRSGP